MPRATGLQMLADATPAERSVLGGLKTSRNHVVLHTDERLLPRRQRSRASWNYHLKGDSRAVALTYDRTGYSRCRCANAIASRSTRAN